MVSKAVVVIGGTSGAGRSIVEYLARNNYEVLAVGRNCKQSKISNCEFFKADISNRKDLLKLKKKLIELENLYAVIHNVGGSYGLKDISSDHTIYEKLIFINFLSIVELNSVLIPKLLSQKSSRLIHMLTSSVFTLKGNIPYVSSKFALLGYTKAMAKKFIDDGMIVCGIAPTAINYPDRYIGKLKKSGKKEWQTFRDSELMGACLVEPDEIVSAVGFFLSDSGKNCSGSIMKLGGY